jgi:hypothetical protein
VGIHALSFPFPRIDSIMKSGLAMKTLLAALLILPLTGCLTQRTVTEGGHTVKQEYVIKRPLKEAVRNSQ